MEGGTVSNPVGGAAAREAHAAGDTVHSSKPGAKAIAAAMVGSIVDGEGAPIAVNIPPAGATPPPADPQVVPGSVPRSVPMPPQPPAEPVTGAEPVPGTPEPEVTPTGPTELEVGGVEVTQELLDGLAEVGFDLPLDVESLRAAPPEVQAVVLPVIGQMIQAADETLEAAVTVESLRSEKAALSKKMAEEGDKLILSLAIAQPDMFRSVADVFAKMEDDPGFRQMVINELNSEAKLAEAERREEALNYRQREAKARQITGHTKRVARQLGLDPDTALKHVAVHIKATEGRDIPIGQIQPLLQQLAAGQAGRQKVVLAPRTPEHATPEARDAQGDAPTGSIEGSVPGIETPPAERSRGIRSKLGGIVKAASQKYDSQ